MTKKHIEAFAKYAGITTICFEWLAVLLFYLLRPADFNGEHPISYFASLPQTRLIFSVCLTVAAISFWIFTRYHLPRYYVVPIRLFTASMLGYAMLALVPYDPDVAISETVHKALALFFSFTFLAGIYIIGKNDKDAKVRRASYLAVWSSALILLVFLATPKGSQFVLLLEAISAFIGQAWIIWISLHSFKAETAKKLS